MTPPASSPSDNPVTPLYAPAAGPTPVRRRAYRWYHKLMAVLLVVFCFEIGLFLVIFPWTPFWDTNYFGSIVPQWHQFWDNLYFRGALSGLGVVNLYIALLEIYRLRRFARR